MLQNFFNRYLDTAEHFLKYGLTIPFYLKNRRFKYTSENSIAVFAQPRGGSTWFSDMLLAMPRTAKIDGPLYQGAFLPDGKMPSGKAAKLKSYRRLNFYFHQYIPEHEVLPEARAFFHRLFSHHFFTPYIFQETSLRRLFFAKKFVFKFYQANLMLPWISRHFDVRPILLVRNPYAVVLSQLHHYAFQETIKTGCYAIPEFRFSRFFDPFKEVLEDLFQPEEILAAMWCLNYVPAITHQGNNREWLTISYESLLLHREEEIGRLFDYLGIGVPDQLDELYRRPSGSTRKPPLAYEDKVEHLMWWKRKLNPEQVKNIESVLLRFGVKGYSQQLEPDYNYIYSINR